MTDEIGRLFRALIEALERRQRIITNKTTEMEENK